MMNNCSEDDFVEHMKSITKGELWEIVKYVRDNVNITRVTNDVIQCDKTEQYSHALAKVMDVENRNDWILVTRSRISK